MDCRVAKLYHLLSHLTDSRDSFFETVFWFFVTFDPIHKKTASIIALQATISSQHIGEPGLKSTIYFFGEGGLASLFRYDSPVMVI